MSFRHVRQHSWPYSSMDIAFFVANVGCLWSVWGQQWLVGSGPAMRSAGEIIGYLLPSTVTEWFPSWGDGISPAFAKVLVWPAVNRQDTFRLGCWEKRSARRKTQQGNRNGERDPMMANRRADGWNEEWAIFVAHWLTPARHVRYANRAPRGKKRKIRETTSINPNHHHLFQLRPFVVPSVFFLFPDLISSSWCSCSHHQGVGSLRGRIYQPGINRNTTKPTVIFHLQRMIPYVETHVFNTIQAWQRWKLCESKMSKN